MIKTIIFGIVAASAVLLVAAELACKDQDGNDVDWFAALKIPKQEDQAEPLNTGFSYAYISGKPLKGKGEEDTSAWKLSKVLTIDEKSIFGRTLAPLYAKERMNYNYIMYNAFSPGGSVRQTKSSAKGVLAMDKDTGFWLIHSVPNFPQFTFKKYEWPDSAKLSGQSALCISFNTSESGKQIIDQLDYMGTNNYVWQSTKNVEDVLGKNEPKNKRAETLSGRQITITSFGQTDFISFARSYNRTRTGDLYEEFVAPTLQQNMFVETWRSEAGNLSPPRCKAQIKVHNINGVKIAFANGAKPADSGSWSYIKDGSKWGVSDAEDKPFVCIGDVNRMASQDKRGGGAVCFSNRNVWKRFSEVIDGSDPCRNSKLKDFFQGKLG